MSRLGQFVGVGVGPGPAGFIPLAAVEALRQADTIFLPRARSSQASVARQCLAGLELPEDRFEETEFTMDPDRNVLNAHYARLAARVMEHLRAGKNVAYVTIGDSLTYSTYAYLLAALLDLAPQLEHRTFPGVTSFAAAAAAMSWPLGEGKERILVLPCPDDLESLRADILSHDIVVLMKIANRLPGVLALLREMDILARCAFARHIGLPGELLCADLTTLQPEESNGYLSTMLIRRNPRVRGHS